MKFMALGAWVDGVPTFSEATMVFKLAQGERRSVAVPKGAKTATFKGTDDFWVRANEDAELRDSMPEGGAPDLNPERKNVEGVRRLSVLAERACRVVVSFYKDGAPTARP